MGPMVYGRIMALYSVESSVLTLHACSAAGVVQLSTGVPPQLLLTRPMGTPPPRVRVRVRVRARARARVRVKHCILNGWG